MFVKYARIYVTEMRPYVFGEDLTHIQVNSIDNPKKDLGMVARNPQNHNDMWYISREYFKTNFKLQKDQEV